MSIWPQYPTLYEINTWVWLSELSLKTGTIVDLSSAPSAEWDGIAKFGFDAVWFMGIWERSPQALQLPIRIVDCSMISVELCPISSQKTMSALYRIRRYVVDNTRRFEGCRTARRQLEARHEIAPGFRAERCRSRSPVGRRHPENFIGER